MGKTSPGTVCIACTVFRTALETLRERGEFDLPVRYLDSLLHMQPKELARRLEARVEREHDQGNQILLLYGDCDPYMIERVGKLGVCRPEGVNCFELLLGSDRFRKLRREGAFFVLPDWAHRWQEVVQLGIGTQRESIRCVMTDMHSKLVYLDLGSIPVPEEDMRAFSDYLGLPWEVVSVSTDHLGAAIATAQEELSQDAS